MKVELGEGISAKLLIGSTGWSGIWSEAAGEGAVAWEGDVLLLRGYLKWNSGRFSGLFANAEA